MSMIKLEIAAYNESACRHIGEALVAIADDLAGCNGLEKRKDKTCAAPPEEIVEVRMVDTPFTPVVDAFTPTVTTPPAPPVPTGLPVTTPSALDADGIPWDNRIHTAAKTQCKDGTWKLRPGVDKDLVAQVKAQLKGVQELPVPPVTVPAPPITDATALFIPPASAVAPAPPAPTAPAPATFAELIKALTPRLTAGTLTADQVNAACQTVGLATCNLLAARQDLIPAVWSQLQ